MLHFLIYLERVGIALSILLNVILGGYSNQTFSARNWNWFRNKERNIVWLIDGTCDYIIEPLVNFFLTRIIRVGIKVSMRNHCLTSWAYWRVRKDVIHEQELLKAQKEKIENNLK